MPAHEHQWWSPAPNLPWEYCHGCRTEQTKEEFRDMPHRLEAVHVTSEDVLELRRRTMGKNVAKLPMGEAFEITNERMLAVRDDLMEFANNQDRRRAVAAREDTEKIIQALLELGKRLAQDSEQTRRVINDLYNRLRPSKVPRKKKKRLRLKA